MSCLRAAIPKLIIGQWPDGCQAHEIGPSGEQQWVAPAYGKPAIHPPFVMPDDPTRRGFSPFKAVLFPILSGPSSVSWTEDMHLAQHIEIFWSSLN